MMVPTEGKSSSHHEKVEMPPEERKNSLLADIKDYPAVAGYCLALTTGILLYGYDLVIVSNVSSMPVFQQDFGRKLNGALIIPSLWLGLWNVANPIGGIFGAVIGGYIQDCFGRRPALALASVISAVGVAVAFVSNQPGDIDHRRAVFFIAKFVQGLAVNMLMCTTQTYMSEVLPPTLRGPILAFFPLFTLLGQLIGSIVVYTSLDESTSTGYKKCFISQWPFSALPLFVSAILPESPTWLLRKNKLDKALASHRRLHTRDPNPNTSLETLRASIAHEDADAHNHPATYADCFRSTNRRRTIIVLFANLVPQLFGMTLLAKSSYFMQVVGMAANASLMILEVGIAVGVVANILSMWTLSRFDRVPLMLAGLIASAILWTGMGIAGCFTGPVTIWWTATSLILIITTTGATVWPTSYAISAETSALRLRAKTQGLGWLVNGLASGVFGLVLPYIFNPDEGALRARTGFVFTGFCLLGVAGTWGLVPEMKDRGVGEIDWLFEMGVGARGFRDFHPGEGRGV